jgi:hypothetical protein
VPFDLGFQWQMAESPRLRKKMAKTHIFSLPHLVSRVSHAFGVSGFLVRVVSVLLRFVCAGTFFFSVSYRFAVRCTVFVCVFILELACGSVFRILRVSAALFEVNFRRFSILFFAVLLCFSRWCAWVVVSLLCALELFLSICS